MRRLTTLMAAVAATFAMSSAQALVNIVDNFDAPSVVLFDPVGGAGGSASYSDATRTIYHEMVTAGGNSFGVNSSVTIGGDSIPPGNLQIRNADTVTSTVTLNWALPAGFVPATGPVTLYFKVYASDDVIKNINATIGASVIGPVGGYNIGVVAAPGFGVFFPIGAADQALLTAGGTLGMTFTGNNGWDLSIDEVGFIIPEPATLGLVGLALLGAGVVSRRRKAA